MELTPATLARDLEQYLRPQTFPLAISLLAGADQIPAGARRPKPAMGVRITICQGVGMARRYGWTIAIGREDCSCPLAKSAFGLEPLLPFFEEGHTCAGMFTATPEAGARTEAATPRLPYGAYPFVLIGPLARAKAPPDVVLLYGNSAQVMRLVQAALWQRGGRLTSGFTGRIDCADEIIAPIETGEPQVILPCNGDRIFGGASDEEMAFSFPYTRAEEILTGLAETHKHGVRYPVPNFLRFEADFPPSYQQLERLWSEEPQEPPGQP